MGKAILPTEAQFKLGAALGKARQKLTYARSIEYRSDRDVFVLRMYSGAVVQLPRHFIEELKGARSVDLRAMRLTPGGGMLWSSALDLHLSVPGVLRRVLGMDWFERAGRARTRAKAAAARKNGLKGGRPRKRDVGIGRRGG